MFVAFFIVANVVSMAVSLVNRPCKLVGRIGAAGVSKQRVTSLITHARSIYCSLVQRLLVLLLYYCLYDNNKYRCNSDRSEPVNESTPRAFVMNFGLITHSRCTCTSLHAHIRAYVFVLLFPLLARHFLFSHTGGQLQILERPEAVRHGVQLFLYLRLRRRVLSQDGA